MLNLNIHFENETGQKLKEAKHATGLTWPEYILCLAGIMSKKEEQE